jgi:hypothetical protein
MRKQKKKKHGIHNGYIPVLNKPKLTGGKNKVESL